MSLFDVWRDEDTTPAALIQISLQYLNELDKEACARCCELLIRGLVFNEGKLIGSLEEVKKEFPKD